MSRSCLYCDGHGTVVLDRSWFVSDGYRLERCGVCTGTGVNPRGFSEGDGWLARQRLKRKLIARWGRQTPPSEAAVAGVLEELNDIHSKHRGAP